MATGFPPQLRAMRVRLGALATGLLASQSDRVWLGLGVGLVAAACGALAVLSSGVTALVLCAVAMAVAVWALGRGSSAVVQTPRNLAWLDRPACLSDLNGHIVTSNDPWAGRTLADILGDAGVYAALRQLRTGQTYGGPVRFGGLMGQLHAARDGAHVVWMLTPEGGAAPVLRPDAGSAQPLGTALDAAPIGVARLDGDDPLASPILEVNAALVAMSDHGAKVGGVLADILPADSHAEARLHFARGGILPFEARLATPVPRDVHIYSVVVGGQTVLYVVDVSSHKQLELQLAQGQKMQAIGQLAGGVAHDFNNLLTAIHLRLDELLSRHPVGDPSYGDLREISQTASRAGALVRKLLAFSRKQTLKRDVIEVGDLVSDLAVLLSRVVSEDVRLDIIHGRDLPTIRADKSQIETAIMNLATNARDAMRGRPNATLTIRTRTASADAVRQQGVEPVADEYAVIEVADNGAGIPPDIREKIFEPFFTTKAVGEGTGLGLATVYGIVKQSDGVLQLDSTVGQGTTFSIYLPAYAAPVADTAAAQAMAPAPVAKPAAVPADLAGRGRILLVEDEDSVRVMAAKLLRARGYEVFEAEDGEVALAFLSGPDNPGIDLMISDVVMPSMDGPTLLKNAKPYLTNTRIIFISGYAEEEFSSVLDTENVSFLPKPFTVKDLAERVKAELGAPV